MSTSRAFLLAQLPVLQQAEASASTGHQQAIAANTAAQATYLTAFQACLPSPGASAAAVPTIEPLLLARAAARLQADSALAGLNAAAAAHFAASTATAALLTQIATTLT